MIEYSKKPDSTDPLISRKFQLILRYEKKEFN